VQCPNKEFFLCGGSDKNGTDSTYSYLVRVDSLGSFVYDNTFSKHTLVDQQFMAVANENNNGVFLVEKAYNSPVGFKLEPTFCIFPSYYASVCNTAGSNEDEIVYDVCRTKDKGYTMIGYTNGFNSQLTDIFLIKVDSTLYGMSNLVGINESRSATLQNTIVYPTITNSIVNIKSAELIKSIKAFDSIGNEILYMKSNNETISVDLSGFPSGFYYFVLNEGWKQQTFKIVKTN
jgi:hypothetical protein